MTVKAADRVKETSTTAGVTDISLDGAVSSFQRFRTGIGNGNRCFYVIEHQTADEWEVGYGTLTEGSPDVLSRDEIVASSTGSKVSLSAGTKNIFVDVLAQLQGALNLYPWRPNDESSCVLFLDAGQGVTGTTTVTHWLDQSTSARTFVFGSQGPPSLAVDGAPNGLRDAILFDAGSSQGLSAPVVDITPPCWGFIICTPNTIQGADPLAWADNTVTTRNVALNLSSAPNARPFYNLNNTANAFLPETPANNQMFPQYEANDHILMVFSEEDTPNVLRTFWINLKRLEYQSDNTLAFPTGMNQTGVGFRPASTPLFFFSGKIYAVGAFNGKLNMDLFEKVRSYSLREWGVG